MPLDPRWVAAPPEIVALIFEGGPGPESIVAYATVMATEAASHQMGMAVSAANIASTSASWTGLAGAANVAHGTALNMGGLEPLAVHCGKHVMLAQAAVDAYTMACPSVIPSVACNANRDLWGTLCATNWFGQNFPPMAAQDLQYFGDYWPQNSSVGVLYATTLGTIAAAAAVPPPAMAGEVAPAGLGSLATLAGQAGSTAGQDAGQVAGTAGSQLTSAGSPAAGGANQLTSMVSQAPQMLSGVVQPMTQMTQMPMQLAQSGMSPIQSLMGMFTGANAGAGAGEAASFVGAPLGGAGGAAAGGMGAGGAGIGGMGSSAASLTSFTQPASTFEPETAGRPTGKAGVLNAADLRSPTTRAGGSAMPMSPAGMLGRGESPTGDKKDDVTHARIVVNPDHQDPQQSDL
jgi:PPE-repeat protein